MTYQKNVTTGDIIRAGNNWRVKECFNGIFHVQFCNKQPSFYPSHAKRRTEDAIRDLNIDKYGIDLAGKFLIVTHTGINYLMQECHPNGKMMSTGIGVMMSSQMRPEILPSKKLETKEGTERIILVQSRSVSQSLLSKPTFKLESVPS